MKREPDGVTLSMILLNFLLILEAFFIVGPIVSMRGIDPFLFIGSFLELQAVIFAITLIIDEKWDGKLDANVKVIDLEPKINKLMKPLERGLRKWRRGRKKTHDPREVIGLEATIFWIIFFSSTLLHLIFYKATSLFRRAFY